MRERLSYGSVQVVEARSLASLDESDLAYGNIGNLIHWMFEIWKIGLLFRDFSSGRREEIISRACGEFG